jgi:hypothetical protein
MKAIKIPNSALLDVFGRPVAINCLDLPRPSITPTPSSIGQLDKNSPNNHYVASNKNSTATATVPKLENAERLSVIGE